MFTFGGPVANRLLHDLFITTSVLKNIKIEIQL